MHVKIAFIPVKPFSEFLNLFASQISEKSLSPPEPKPYEEEFKKRFMLELQALKFKLCAVLNADGNIIENPPNTAKSSNVSSASISLNCFFSCLFL